MSGTEILLTGGSGLLGRALRRIEPEIVAPPHAELDVTRPAEVAAALDRVRPRIVIHAAAIVGTRAGDEDPASCLDVNAGGTLHVARGCLATGARLVYVSTDYVFDGSRGGYREDDPVSPVNTYARSKVAGEMIALAVPNALIVRTSFCDGSAWKFPTAFVDQWTSRDVVDRIALELLAAARSPLTGLLHIGTERRSQFELAQRIDPSVRPLSLADVDLVLPRDVSLDSTRWRSWRE